VDSLDLNWRRLAGRIPEAAEAEASRIVRAFKGEVALTPPRSSKWGSYRWRPDLGAKIFLNRDLQPEAMLITLLHELAHAQVRSWDGIGCMPHGSEWQGRYRDLLGPFLDVPGVFSPAVVRALKNQLHKPKASCGAAPDLLRALRADSDALRVEQLPEAMLITLLHELAHAQVRSWDGVGCMPHGSEWQGRYRDLLGPFLDVPGVFSPAVVTALNNQLHKPKASCGAAPDLLRALRTDSDALRVEQLPEGCWFRLANGMEFRKGPKRRSRFACTEKKTGRTFTVHALAEATRSQE